jgi:hypothetical protein
MREKTSAQRVLVGNLTEKDHYADLDVEGRIQLKYIVTRRLKTGIEVHC